MTARALQTTKIRELREALIGTGYVRLDDQASVLGLSRSTTWTIMHGKHKTAGLSASVVKRILAQPPHE
jgi:predicted DNA-binding transcriptional regulator AlpA